MTVNEFRRSPSESFQGVLLALWWQMHGDWKKAHELAAGIGGRDGARVHAYLHRREGDRSNAAYWYRQAGAPVESGDLDAEMEALVTELLGN